MQLPAPWAFALLFGCILRLILIWSRTPGFDESKTLLIVQAPFAQVLSLVSSMESQPLYFLLAKAWTLIFKDPLSSRILSLLSGTAALFLFWRLVQRLGSDDIFPLLLGATSPYWIYMSQDARPYSLFLLAALAQSILAWDLHRCFSAKLCILYGLVAVFGTHLHYYFGVLLALHFPLVAVKLPPRRFLWWIGLHILIAVLCLPSLFTMPAAQFQITKALLREPLGFLHAMHIVGTMLMDIGYLGFLYGNLYRAAGLACALMLGAGLWVSYRRNELLWSTPIVLCAYYVVGAFLMAKAMELAVGYPVTQARYFVFVSPMLYLGISESLHVWPSIMRRLSKGALLLATATATGAYFFSNVFLAPNLPRLSRAIRTQFDHNEVLLYPDSYYYLAMRYYFLPQRRQYFIGRNRREIVWDALPGYRATMEKEEVARLPACLVVDFGRLLSPRPLWRTDGNSVARAMDKPLSE